MCERLKVALSFAAMKAVRPFAPALLVLATSAVAGLACKRSSGAPTPGGSAAPLIPAPAASAPAPLTPLAPITTLSKGALIEDERNTISVFRETAASAVFVTQKQVVFDPWGEGATEVDSGSGSGFVWDKEGHVVTNFHVVQGVLQNRGKLTVTLQDQSTLPAEIRGVEPKKDIAVLKINTPADKLVPIRLRDPKEELLVGQKTIAIGNPFGFDHTLTVGIVSALGRAMPGVGNVTIRDMIQTDAAINPGNSGGPLLDSSGRLIGMNTQIYSRSGTSSGVGFAVPATAIQRIVPQIIRTGRAEQVGLGISILEGRSRVRGVIVRDVLPGSAAERAGLRSIPKNVGNLTVGDVDVIVGVNDHTVKNYDDLYNALDRYQAGDKVTLKVQRGDKIVAIPVELQLIQPG